MSRHLIFIYLSLSATQTLLVASIFLFIDALKYRMVNSGNNWFTLNSCLGITHSSSGWDVQPEFDPLLQAYKLFESTLQWHRAVSQAQQHEPHIVCKRL